PALPGAADPGRVSPTARTLLLSSGPAAVVRSTLPAVSARGTEITGRFYSAMFAAHPELRHLFNQGNQANGEQRRALAGSVAAFAEPLVPPDPATPVQQVLPRLAHQPGPP